MDDFKGSKLGELVERCREQTDLYLRHESYDPRFCFEIWRRAVVERDEAAWQSSVDQYAIFVRRWLSQRLANLPGLRFEEEVLVNAVFFNFYRFVPGDPYFRFTPYVTFGVGVFNYDPYAYLANKKYYLRTLGTEGQGSSLYPDRKPYSSMAFSVPVGVGFKYALNYRMNVGFEIVHRFTNTDYLDDVSKTYPDPAVFPPNPDGTPSAAQLLSDRSYELGTPIGAKGVQRGISTNKDQFATAIIYLSFNLQSYKCPTSN